MNQMHIGQRIKKRREQIGLSLQDVADKLDVNRSSVMRWENGETLKIKLPIVEKLAQILQTSPDYLMGYKNTDDSFLPGYACPADNACFLPVLRRIVGAENLFEKQNIIDYELADGRYRYAHYFYLSVAGDSMAPYLVEQDRVLVKQQDYLKNGQIGVFIIDGQNYMIREYYRNKGVELRAFNPYYPALHFSNAEEKRVQIIGHITESKRLF
ncbi:MAG: helix-turn-helix domain-containing protein [Ruminococcaceae bacterium]|nr:helix-turn-helix domain-containing protein [Oscillospiraceae bacterium]